MKFTIEERKTGSVSRFPCWMVGASGNIAGGVVDIIYLFLSDSECIWFGCGGKIQKYYTSPSSLYKPFHGTFTIEV